MEQGVFDALDDLSREVEAPELGHQIYPCSPGLHLLDKVKCDLDAFLGSVFACRADAFLNWLGDRDAGNFIMQERGVARTKRGSTPTNTGTVNGPCRLV